MPNARKILVVDDDADLRDALMEQLSLHEEFVASAADTGAKGIASARADAPALIIMLTGHDTDSDTILGLESGANDYITKPFRFAVLLARIRAQLRQHEAS